MKRWREGLQFEVFQQSRKRSDKVIICWLNTLVSTHDHTGQHLYTEGYREEGGGQTQHHSCTHMVVFPPPAVSGLISWFEVRHASI